MKQYKTRKPNQNLAYIIFLQSKSQKHIAIKCINPHHHRLQEINIPLICLIPRTIQTEHFPCTAKDRHRPKHPRFLPYSTIF
jgi:predicted transcriptional regulator YheO